MKFITFLTLVASLLLFSSCSSTPNQTIERKLISHSSSFDGSFKGDRTPAGGIGSLLSSCKNLVSRFFDDPKRFEALADKAVAKADDPYGSVYSLSQFKQFDGDVDSLKSSVREFYEIMAESNSDLGKEKLTKWIESDHHALFAYQSLYSDGLHKHTDTLDYLFTHNDHFKDIKRIRGPPQTAVTYSFEKESSINDIALWYKDAKLTDDQWFEMSEQEQIKRLNELTRKHGLKKFLPADKVAPTEFRPKYLSGYSRELETQTSKGYSWEIANKLYEVNLDQLFKQIDEVTEFAKETHSIHSHVVFEMSKSYKKFAEFSYWSKQVNDYLFLKGMEESLHGSELVGIATLSQSRHSHNAKKMAKEVQVSFDLPTKSPTELHKQNYKFFSMGLRGDIYGESTTDGMIKVGLELRDTSRNMKTLRSHMDKVSDSVADHKWEKLAVTQIEKQDDVTFLLTSKSKSIELMSKYMDEDTAAMFVDFDLEAVIPFMDFENGKFLDYDTGGFRQASAEQIERITEAREEMIKDLDSIKRELAGYRENGESFAKEDVQMAIRMSLTTWAKKAKASELFSNF